MNKKFVIPIILISLFFSSACSIALEGISIGDAQEPSNPIKEMFEQETLTAIENEEAGSASAEATAVPEYQDVISPGSDMERVVAGSHEYAVAATNFDCTCQETANMTVDFNFTGDQVEITNGGGGATMVYDKIGENKYKRTFMSYYILTSGEGDQLTETKVEEEQQVIITLTGNGYVMESYGGDSSSPCCYYTFTVAK